MFTTHLEYLCGKKRDHESTHYIHFKGQYLYVTNGKLVLKQHLSLYGFNDGDMRMMDGRMIHKDVFKMIKNRNLEFNMTSINVYVTKDHYYRIYPREYFWVRGADKLIERMNNSFEKFEMIKTIEVTIDPGLVGLIKKGMLGGEFGLTFRFNESGGGILISSNKMTQNEHALIISSTTMDKKCH